MRDNLRRYRAIRDTLTQGSPGQLGSLHGGRNGGAAQAPGNLPIPEPDRPLET
jgi:hypothetical protein